MPDWKEANRDELGFPLTKKGKMDMDQRLQFLLEEITALHARIKTIENSFQILLERVGKN
ncbi:MAG: hypothetical protein ACFFD4_05900 [Candidatus Odinarchaeota archaeon]